MAIFVLWAGRAQAIFSRRSHQRDHAGALIQTRQLGQIASWRSHRPFFNFAKRQQRRSLHMLLPRKLQTMQAEVAAAAFEQRRARR